IRPARVGYSPELLCAERRFSRRWAPETMAGRLPASPACRFSERTTAHRSRPTARGFARGGSEVRRGARRGGWTADWVHAPPAPRAPYRRGATIRERKADKDVQGNSRRDCLRLASIPDRLLLWH